MSSDKVVIIHLSGNAATIKRESVPRGERTEDQQRMADELLKDGLMVRIHPDGSMEFGRE